MEQKKQICISDELSSDYPWLIAHNLDPKENDTGDQIFFTIHDSISRFRCRIPELVGREIRGCFHGWMILSKRNPGNIEWSLWNPVISKLIGLPRLILKDKDDDDFRYCCLSSPPDDSGSILLLMRWYTPEIVFFNCERRKRLRRWSEMSYSKQLMNITGDDDVHPLLYQPTCCNGNIYALSDVSDGAFLIQIQINVFKKKQGVINLLPLVQLPLMNCKNCINDYFFLKGSGTQLFTIALCAEKWGIPSNVNLFKLDMSSMMWTQINDLKDTIFFVCQDVYRHDLVYSSPPIASELGGGYVHVLKENGDEIFSYDFKDKTISMSLMHRFNDLPLCSISVWPTMPEFRLPKCKDGDHDDQMVLVTSATTDTTMNDDDDDDDYDDGYDDDDDVDDDDEMKNEACILNTSPFDFLEAIMKFCVGISIWPNMPEFRLPKCNDGDHDDQMVLVTSATDTTTTMNDDDDDDDDEIKNEACILNTLPFDVLEAIMKFCVGIEYLNFRATCKLCHLAAPMIQWSKERMRLQKYSLVSPWLMLMDKNQGIITFMDPMFGDIKYFIKAISPELFYDDRILCSRFGWLLLYISDDCVAFFNPFTTDIINLPPIDYCYSFSFSAPPTSPDCLVIALDATVGSMEYLFHRVGREPFNWQGFSVVYGVERPHFSWFATFYGKDVYCLLNRGVLDGGGLEVFREIENHENPPRKQIVDIDTAPSRVSANSYHVKCDEHHLLVIVGKYGESVDVFKLNGGEWEKIDGLGSHMIYICEASCLCMEAKIPEMENKIYFPRLNCENEKIVFYSLETCKYHTFNGRKMEQNILTDFFETKRTVYAHAWIEPTWF